MNAKRILGRLAIVLVSAFVIIYAMIQLISGLTADVSYEYVSLQSVDKTLEKTGYLIRNESILYAENEGILSYSVSESQKIGINQQVATVYSSSRGIDLQNEIDALEQKIDILSRSSVDTGYLTSDVSKIDSKIATSLVNARGAIENKDLSMITSYKEDLLINMNKRELVTSGQGDFSQQIEDLKQKKNQLTSSLQDPLSTIYAKKAGYFSTLLDGYETVFTPDRLKNLTLQSFDELIQTPQVEYTNSAVGKLITDFDWYTVCEIEIEESESFSVGREYPITYLYSSGQQLTAKLDQKITQTDSDRVLLVFLIEEVPSDFDYTRQQSVKIVLESKKGILFPASALRMVNGVQGVYVVAGNVVDFKKVDIIDSLESKYLSKEQDPTEKDASEYLSRFDRVITEGKDLYVGKILD